MELIVFLVSAVVAIIGAVAMLLSKDAIHSALFLLLNMIAIAVLYLLLRAPFLFAVQLIVYAGAIVVLFLFVVMLLGAERAEEQHDNLGWQRPVALLMGLLLLGEAFYVFSTGAGTPPATTQFAEDFASPIRISEALFTTYLLPFEVTSVILLAAIVGVVVLHTRERRDLTRGDEP
jgi:NADH-quinone oxidoreductase subunit J